MSGNNQGSGRWLWFRVSDAIAGMLSSGEDKNIFKKGSIRPTGTGRKGGLLGVFIPDNLDS
ncbi:MAG: hypothetical protein JO126_07620 [Alphaproteobacteria bacterium]|nr:hypothetical protein [Alphaproteobacteria bacterium]MBV8549307.1 hypothetical protein [Alphaproteobacteria bacterium]